MTRRPPTLVTRRSSASARSTSLTLRSPKEMVTASKVSSANGRASASPATTVTPLREAPPRRSAPTRSMPSEKSQAMTRAPRRAKDSEEVPVPAARSSTSSPL